MLCASPSGPRSKASVCRRSHAEITVWNPTAGMNVCLLWF